MLDAFPSKAGIYKGRAREYPLRHADIGDGQQYTVAILRQIEQGNGEAQTAARDLIDEDPRVHRRGTKTGQAPAYAADGGPIDQALASAVANLAAREDELGDWTSALPAPPPVTWTRKGQLYGPPEWQSELRDKLEHHHGEGATRRAPIYAAGPIASSDRLVKDPALLIPWLTTARNRLAVAATSSA